MKLTIKENFRVTVYPEPVSRYIRRTQEKQEEAYEIDCKYIKQQIERHIDNFSNVEIDWDTKEICSHCEYEWDVDKKTGEPLCCEEASNEWKQEVENENSARDNG